MRSEILKNITDKADELANEYNRNRDPGIRDQWFKLIKTVSQYPEPRETPPPKLGRKKILGKAAIR